MREPGASVRDLPGAKVRPSVSVWWGGAAVFLDYDGTLTPIADRPGDAVISAGKRTSSWRSRPLARVVRDRDRDRDDRGDEVAARLTCWVSML
jgi:hypothetical protein